MTPFVRAFLRPALAATIVAMNGTALAQDAAVAIFYDVKGQRIGTATLRQTEAGVVIRADVERLPPGEHAFHIHEKGRCNPEDGFKSAGGHYAPNDNPHGFPGRSAHHAGDMPNQTVSSNGELRVEVLNPHVAISRASLLDEDGSALIVHAKPDDYRSQPSGAAGDRIACAVIRRQL